MNNSEEDIKNNCIAYAEAFLQAYTAFLDENYSEVVKPTVAMGFDPLHIPHYQRELGKNISISALCAKQNFYLYFVKPAKEKVKTLRIGLHPCDHTTVKVNVSGTVLYTTVE